MSSIDDTLKKLKVKHDDKQKEHNEHDHIPESLKGAIVNSEKFNEFIKKSEIRDIKTGKKANVKGFILVNAVLVVIVILTVIYFLKNENERLIGEAKISTAQSNIPSNGRPYDPNYKGPINTPTNNTVANEETKSTNNIANSKNMVGPAENKEENNNKVLPPFPLGGKVSTTEPKKDNTASKVDTTTNSNKQVVNQNINQNTGNADNTTYRSTEKNTFHGFFGIPLTNFNDNNTKVETVKEDIGNNLVEKKYTNQNNHLIAASISRGNNQNNNVNANTNKNVVNNKNNSQPINNIISKNNEPLDKNYHNDLGNKNNNMLPLDGNSVESINSKLNYKNNEIKKQNVTYGIKEFLYLTDQNKQFDKYSTLKYIIGKNKPVDKNKNTKLLSNSEIVLYNKYINYGNEAVTRGTYEYAIEYFTKAIEISKDDNLVGTIILMYLENKNPNYAFQTIVTNGLQNTRILTATIIDMVNNQYFLEATKVIEYAKTLDPSYDIYFATGYFYNMQNQYDLALKFYNYSIEANPEFPISIYFKARLLEKIDKKSRNDAIALYKQIMNMKNIDKKIKDAASSRYNALNGTK